MDLGYWINNKLIYGPEGYTGYWIDNDQIFSRSGYTRLWISKDHIYSSTAGNTGFWIEGQRIQGPGRELPWVQLTKARQQAVRQQAARDVHILRPDQDGASSAFTL